MTELLDSAGHRSYSQDTCNEAGRQAEACRGLVDTGDSRVGERDWAAESRSRAVAKGDEPQLKE